MLKMQGYRRQFRLPLSRMRPLLLRLHPSLRVDRQMRGLPKPNIPQRLLLRFFCGDRRARAADPGPEHPLPMIFFSIWCVSC